MTIRTLGSETNESLLKCSHFNTMAAEIQLETRGFVDDPIKKNMDWLVYEAGQRIFHEAQAMRLEEYVALGVMQYKLSNLRTRIYFEETFHMKF